MLKLNKQRHRRPTSLADKLLSFGKRPWIIVLIVTILLTGHIVLLGRLVYGDIPDYSVQHSQTNALYAWGPQQFGTPVRQGLNTLRDTAILSFARFDFAFYFVKYILPIMLVPFVYYWILYKLGIRNRFALVVGSLFPLFTPIVFGDFLTGQTFWIYLTVPFVFYYAILLFCWQQFTIKNSLLLGVWLFLSLGMLPPIIVPLMGAIALLAGAMFLSDYRTDGWKLVGHYALSGGIIVITFALLAAPYVLVASSGQSAYTPPSLLGDYYHNYAASNLVNTLRMAGNNGSGQSTLGYNLMTPVTAIGFLLMLGVLIGSVGLGLHKRINRYQAMLVGLLAALLAIIAFMHLLNTDPLIGVKVFESQWLVSTVRNPSKLYAIMLPIFVLLFGFGLQFYFARFRGRMPATLIGLITIVLVCSYGWPALRGDLGLLYGREDKIANYKASPTVREAISHVENRNDRSLLIPANHRDELNYQFMAPGFNILGLEGSLPHTSLLTRSITSSFNDRNPYFFRYLETAGVKNIFVQKDPAAYEESRFALFSVELTPEQARDFAASHLRLVGETKTAWQFQNDHANSLLYSPSQITTIGGNDTLQTKAPFMAQNTALLHEDPTIDTSLTTHFSTKNSLQDNERIATGKAQLHDSNLLIVDLYSQQENDKYFVVFDILDPLTDAVQRSLRYEVAPTSQIITIGDDRYAFGTEKQRVALRAGEYQAIIGSPEVTTIGNSDPSFETDPPKIVDATPRAPGTAQLYANKSKDRTKDRSSLLIGSSNHLGFVAKDLPIDDPNVSYIVSFDYKNIKGSELSFDVLQNEQSLMLGNGKLNSSPEWQSRSVFFQPDPDSKATPQIYFYANGYENQPSENLVDNIQLIKVVNSGTVNLSLPSYLPDIDLQNYEHHRASDASTENLLANNSFEDKKLWGKVGDATAGASGAAAISAKQSGDAVDGKHSLELSSSNHAAFVAQGVPNFKRNSVYKLSFHYKHVSGRKPSFAIWQNGAEIARPSQELKPTEDGWNYFETYFVPDKDTTSLTLYLYSRSIGDKTVNLFDDVSIETASLVATYFSKQHDPTETPGNLIASFKRNNPSEITIDARRGKGMIVLNESFHKGWQAYIKPKDQPKAKATLINTHTEVNGFVNGWWIDSSHYPDISNSNSYAITLRYEPQKFLSNGLISTGVTATLIAGYLLYDLRKRKRDEIK
jgi:hypothetical protein